MKRVYISFPISDYDLEERKKYAKDAKVLVSRLLQKDPIEQYKQFQNTITPFDVCPETDKLYSYYMGKDIEALLECDTVYFCEGWQNSKGCMAEFEVARIYGKEIIIE